MALAKLQPIDTTTLHERAYQQMRKALMTGMFKPGEAVTLRGVAEALGTSVMPVREAVRRLVSERALEMPTSRSIRVPRMSRARYDELCGVRILLEGEAASQAAVHITEAELAEAERLNDEVERRVLGGDLTGMLEVNQEFHALIYAAAHNELLLAMIETLWLQGGPYLTLLAEAEDDGGAKVAFEPHRVLLEALRARDAEGARRAIRNDIAEAAHNYRAQIDRRLATSG